MPATQRTVPRVTLIVAPDDDLDLLPGLAAAGVDGFQVRAKGLGDGHLLVLVRRVRERVGPEPTVLVNDRADIALAAAADGVHLGGDDLPVPAVRHVVDQAGRGRDFLVGATCRTPADVVGARAAGADYAGYGPVWPSTSKQGLPEPRGLHGALGVTAASGPLPLVAIGGITVARAREAVAAGAHGVAVIAGVWREPDPVAAAARLVDAVHSHAEAVVR